MTIQLFDPNLLHVKKLTSEDIIEVNRAWRSLKREEETKKPQCKGCKKRESLFYKLLNQAHITYERPLKSIEYEMIELRGSE